MTDLQALLLLWAVHMLAVMSPGQSFLLVSRTALSAGRGAAFASAAGMAAGIAPWAIAAMLGLALLFAQAQWLYALIKIVGGAYLIYLAIMVWRHAPEPIAVAPQQASARTALMPAFRDAFLTQITNPKVGVFFGSIFVTVLPPEAPLWLNAAIFALVFFNELVWYALVAVLFSSGGPRTAYLRLKPWVDRAMAGLLALIGARLIIDHR